ncbi:MAG: hypothetical protein WBD41_13025 [Rhodococcus sp. (in: high G+C Gram-positive bacteria)]
MVAVNVDRVKQIREQLTREVEGIRENRRLSVDGQRAEIAAAYTKSRRQLDEMKTAHSAGIKAERSRLEREVFGLTTPDPGAIIGFRDAIARAESIETEAGALKEIDIASRYGDTIMMKAIAAKAVRYGWDDVVHAFDEHVPGSHDKLNDLAALPTGIEANLELMAGFHLQAPKELGSMSSGSIERLAETDAHDLVSD